jgi:integrase/recombinase XerD
MAADPTPLSVPVQATTDARLIELWLHDRPRTTTRAYRSESVLFLEAVGKPIREVMLEDLQRYKDTLSASDLAPATRARRLASVKSLFAFAHRIGYLPFDIGRAVRLPKVRSILAERILDEADVRRMLILEADPRNHLLLRMLYLVGFRISEAADLSWRDVTKRDNTAQVTVFGKGERTRIVRLPPAFAGELLALRGEARPGDPMFPSRTKGRRGRLTARQIHRIVKRAAARAGLSDAVSAHWLRHAHASHAIARGAPPPLVQQTLGHFDLRTTYKYIHAKPNESSATYLVE